MLSQSLSTCRDCTSSRSAIVVSATVMSPCLVMLPKYNATCSDGSPVGFYFRPAPADGQRNKLTIWLKGGAMCADYEDCVTRKSQNL